MFKWFNTLVSLFYSWVRSLVYKYKPGIEEIVDNDYQLLSCNEIPYHMKSKTIYLEGNSKALENNWYAHFICPCGCEEKIMLNLLDDVSPSWSLILKEDKTKFSIKPSIWRTKNCRSHFWITDGKIVWV